MALRVLSIFGTRPEAIKMAPVVQALAGAPGITSLVCVTGQHRQMLDQVLELFAIEPDYDLDLMVPNQTLNGLSARAIAGLDEVLTAASPDRVLVHGDTTTAMAASVAAFHRGIPVGHVEAGLRTYDLARPWPEEFNRRIVDVAADLLFAPTPLSARNLAGERLSGRVIVTGNTVIDALLATRDRIAADAALSARLAERFAFLEPGRRVLLVTGHRRENFGAGFEGICEALARLADRSDIDIVYPVHLNPNVNDPVRSALSGRGNVHLIEPLDYLPFVGLMTRAHAILTDSGGVQEEAPALGKPVLVMRDVTERPEAVEAGTVRLVGTDADRIVRAVSDLWDDEALYRRFAHAANPYGDGKASARIAAALQGEPVDEFAPTREEA
ncbi:non-hydrolyzing UDP-N-acetylglucosamine 2-epimerase [Segnochrobactrum spirostomi]|uniref:UDP-N-acetylglucosamine 2-epimerase (non-hydrolyzing) n=1 Tax=Segnochrobactrum spirostomi TaxID=2608987 RepID=A0A6A7Y2E8_9HYPH|nr:UDP-N-acetylglucosamine 2-epimerase (non-hydrolyzing) [Segnochrobactrum spirostomi]